MDQATFEAAVLRAKELIVDGDLFQVNLARRFSAELDADPADLLASLLANNPSPWMALLPLGECTVVSGSPDLLFGATGGRIRTRPIAGPRNGGSDPPHDAAMERDRFAGPKTQQEHT